MTVPAGPMRNEAERNIALLAYGLLFVSIFFAGTTALVAVVIAYALRDAATPELASHFRFQTRIFWIALALFVLTVATAIAAGLGTLGNVLNSRPPGDWFGQISVGDVDFDVDDIHITPIVILLACVSGISGMLGALWLICAPAVGFVRLATSRHMGETAHS